MFENRIKQQLSFLAELDKLKGVLRQSPLVDQSRKENSAEHSWHLAMFALVLSEHAPEVDTLHVLKLLLVHDIVEIDAGDSPMHAQNADQDAVREKEQEAAKRIFGLLPSEQGKELLNLWLEFEDAQTTAARFAKALDRLQPLYINTLASGGTWAENQVTKQQVAERYGPVIDRGAPMLWKIAEELVAEHFKKKGET